MQRRSHARWPSAANAASRMHLSLPSRQQAKGSVGVIVVQPHTLTSPPRRTVESPFRRLCRAAGKCPRNGAHVAEEAEIARIAAERGLACATRCSRRFRMICGPAAGGGRGRGQPDRARLRHQCRAQSHARKPDRTQCHRHVAAPVERSRFGENGTRQRRGQSRSARRRGLGPACPACANQARLTGWRVVVDLPADFPSASRRGDGVIVQMLGNLRRTPRSTFRRARRFRFPPPSARRKSRSWSPTTARACQGSREPVREVSARQPGRHRRAWGLTRDRRAAARLRRRGDSCAAPTGAPERVSNRSRRRCRTEQPSAAEPESAGLRARERMTEAMHLVLIVEDDQALQSVLRTLSRANGFGRRRCSRRGGALTARLVQSDIALVRPAADRDGLNAIIGIRGWPLIPPSRCRRWYRGGTAFLLPSTRVRIDRRDEPSARPECCRAV